MNGGESILSGMLMHDFIIMVHGIAHIINIIDPFIFVQNVRGGVRLSVVLDVSIQFHFY